MQNLKAILSFLLVAHLSIILLLIDSNLPFYKNKLLRSTYLAVFFLESSINLLILFVELRKLLTLLLLKLFNLNDVNPGKTYLVIEDMQVFGLHKLHLV